jgi:hypothetical protein
LIEKRSAKPIGSLIEMLEQSLLLVDMEMKMQKGRQMLKQNLHLFDMEKTGDSIVQFQRKARVQFTEELRCDIQD